MKYLRSIYAFAALFASLYCTGVYAQSHLLDEGISWELAQYRKSTINNLHYALSFSIPADKNECVEGREVVSFNLAELTSVILDFKESADKIKAVYLLNTDKGRGTRADVKKCKWQFVNGHIVISKKSLHKGRNAVCIEFEAGNQSLNRRSGYVYTLFVPDRAHTVFPCFDQPNMKAKFHLTLEVPQTWSVAQNGLSTVDDAWSQGSKPGYIRRQYEINTPIPTYLFAFAAGEFKYQKYEEDGYKIGAYYRETDSARIVQLPDIMHQVVFSLKWQEEFTGVKYPFPKYELVILPGFQFGGMEHVGATFYNDNRLFLPANPTPDELLNRTELISHETSHMWFGDAVTMDWFNDVWTKEVLANYFAAEITAPLFPDVDPQLHWLRSYQGSAISQDRTEGRTSIRQPLDNMRYAGLIYNNIIYNKAPVMMRKMVNLMGKDAFRRGIQKYVRTYKYDNATWDDLIDILDAETDVDLKSFSKEWVDTAKWPIRKAVSYAEAFDTDYYGYTELTKSQVDSLIRNYPKTGAQSMAAMMTLYENYLNKTIGAEEFLDIMFDMVSNDDPLTCSTAIRYMSEPIRDLQLSLPMDKIASIEKRIYDICQSHKLASVRTQALRLLISKAVSKEMIDILYGIWQENDYPLLSINDYMTLSYELSVRMPEEAFGIIAAQRLRITDPDRQSQFDFISRATNANEMERDKLFESLKHAENRCIEPWTLSVLYYLNHPLRDKESVKYIRPALELLTEIQQTGDIFFPEDWCSNLLAGHRSAEAYREVETFLNDHPEMLQLLRNKVLQAEYFLKRANPI